jgi:hypothetical protein
MDFCILGVLKQLGLCGVLKQLGNLGSFAWICVLSELAGLLTCAGVPPTRGDSTPVPCPYSFDSLLFVYRPQNIRICYVLTRALKFAIAQPHYTDRPKSHTV